jgi:excisionase family DNA binding protein
MTDTEAETTAFTISEAMKKTCVSRARFYELLNTGELRAIRIGGRTVVRASDLAAFLASRPAYVPRPKQEKQRAA